MSILVNCPKCRVEIESDSYYCDQCGVELYICPQCHVFGKGKRCTQCGQPLVSAANQVVSPVHPSTSSVNSSASSVSPAPSEPEKTMRPGVSVPPLPVRLVCSAAGIRLGLGNGARLQKSASGQWEIVDLDSTNGTFVNGNRLSPNVPAVFSIGDIVRIANLDFKVE